MTLQETTKGVWTNQDAGKSGLNECIVCTFSDKQEDIIETKEGYAHQECINDMYAQEETMSKLDLAFEPDDFSGADDPLGRDR